MALGQIHFEATLASVKAPLPVKTLLPFTGIIACLEAYVFLLLIL